MVARRLWTALQQVIRSVLIILFPLAFITLFAWATAGSTYGTTSDPMRAAVWL
jgi:preprotein translocase subunit SecE